MVAEHLWESRPPATPPLLGARQLTAVSDQGSSWTSLPLLLLLLAVGVGVVAVVAVVAVVVCLLLPLLLLLLLLL